jgi:Cu/Ag efflux protein CusF
MAEVFILRHRSPRAGGRYRILVLGLCWVQCCICFCDTYLLILRLNDMRSKKVFVISAVLLVGAGAASIYLLSRPKQPRAMTHPLTGYVLEVNPELKRITVRSEDMPGVMASMVMDYRVKDAHVLAGIKPGDTIQATMVMDGGYSLEEIKVTGKRP